MTYHSIAKEIGHYHSFVDSYLNNPDECGAGSIQEINRAHRSGIEEQYVERVASNSSSASTQIEDTLNEKFLQGSQMQFSEEFEVHTATNTMCYIHYSCQS